MQLKTSWNKTKIWGKKNLIYHNLFRNVIYFKKLDFPGTKLNIINCKPATSLTKSIINKNTNANTNWFNNNLFIPI